jgi:hypothetical protein
MDENKNFIDEDEETIIVDENSEISDDFEKVKELTNILIDFLQTDADMLSTNITCIDGVPVYCYFKKNKKCGIIDFYAMCRIYFEDDGFELANFMLYTRDDKGVFCEKQLMSSVNFFLKCLPRLKLDLQGELSSCSSFEYVQNKTFDFFENLNFSNIEVEFKSSEKCVSCSNPTKTTTPCNHSLCIRCWCLIKREDFCIPCPVCQKNISTFR